MYAKYEGDDDETKNLDDEEEPTYDSKYNVNSKLAFSLFGKSI